MISFLKCLESQKLLRYNICLEDTKYFSSSVTIFVCGGTWGVNQKVEQPNIITKKCGVEIQGKRIEKAVTEFLLTIAKIETKKLTGTED